LRKQALRAAASSSVSGGMRRVFTSPLRGAFAMTAMGQTPPRGASLSGPPCLPAPPPRAPLPVRASERKGTAAHGPPASGLAVAPGTPRKRGRGKSALHPHRHVACFGWRFARHRRRGDQSDPDRSYCLVHEDDINRWNEPLVTILRAPICPTPRA